MKRTASIDIGGTNTHCVLMEGREILAKALVPNNSLHSAKKCFRSILHTANMTYEHLDNVGVTGGGSRKLKETDLGTNFTRVEEITAIGTGGMYLSGQNNVFIVNIGTGTAMVAVKHGEIIHPGGSGLGGGTIQGLSNTVLHTSVADMETLAQQGNRKEVDLTVGEIIGTDLGKIPAEATASNLAKLTRNSKKRDIAAGLLNLMAESLGVIAYFAASNYGLEQDILVCGQVAMNGYLQTRINEVINMMEGHSAIPTNAEFCTAIGAALNIGSD